MSKTIFRDEFEDMAYAVITHYKYGSYGGMVPTNDIRRIGNVLRGHSIDPPKIKLVPLVVKLPVVAPALPVLPVLPKLP